VETSAGSFTTGGQCAMTIGSKPPIAQAANEMVAIVRAVRSVVEGVGVSVRHGDVKGGPLHSTRARRAANCAVMLRAAIGGAENEGPADAVAQGLETVECLFVDPQLPCSTMYQGIAFP